MEFRLCPINWCKRSTNPVANVVTYSGRDFLGLFKYLIKISLAIVVLEIKAFENEIIFKITKIHFFHIQCRTGV